MHVYTWCVRAYSAYVTATLAPRARLSIAGADFRRKTHHRRRRPQTATAAIRVLGVCGGGGNGGGRQTRYHKRYNILYAFLYLPMLHVCGVSDRAAVVIMTVYMTIMSVSRGNGGSVHAYTVILYYAICDYIYYIGLCMCVWCVEWVIVRVGGRGCVCVFI